MEPTIDEDSGDSWPNWEVVREELKNEPLLTEKDKWARWEVEFDRLPDSLQDVLSRQCHNSFCSSLRLIDFRELTPLARAREMKQALRFC